MTTRPLVLEDELVEVPSRYIEPRLAFKSLEPRKTNNLTLIDGKTFLSTTVAGEITPSGAPDVGFFHDDTRFLSHMELRVEGARTTVLSASTEKSFASQVELTPGNTRMPGTLDLPEHTVHIRREQLLGGDVFFDRLTFENFNLASVPLKIELVFDADFVDVFQVRGCERKLHGQYFRPVATDRSLAFYYRGRDGVLRKTLIELSPSPEEIAGQKAVWRMELPPLGQGQVEIAVTPMVENREVRAADYNHGSALRSCRDAFYEWQNRSTRFQSSNHVFDESMNTCVADFHGLRIPENQEHVVAAGIPWFATLFGRDSIIASYQSLILNPELAVDTLRVLAHLQGREVNDWRDEQPGKIIHEYRDGEMTRSGEMPFGPYYGSVDATPLFLILLSEAWNWTGDEGLVRDLLPAAYRALEWIDHYGDLDGDGLVEYLCRSKRGLVNQGWKDSWDANMHRDASVAEPPLALVEVQGYVYDAKYRMASLLRHLGDGESADRLRREAADMGRRIERLFWLPSRSFYAMGLDGKKRPLDVISSNPGHLLFTRMLSRERARGLVDRLMRDDMFSGWGWRTLSNCEKGYNPMSYHRGSVWPHDNSIIAHGMALNEFRAPVVKVFTSLFQAALNFRDYRLPELFCGMQRREFDEPVHYPVSCSPQAWASGAFFLILTSLLGIRPSASRNLLNIINPELPDWLDYLHIRNLRIGKSLVGLDFVRRGPRTFCNVVDVEGDRLLVNVVFKK
jgi:glycogen debranching enzyme